MATSPRLGNYVVSSTTGEEVRAFLPPPLPPEPALSLTAADQDLMENANRALGRLDGVASLLPDTALFVTMYVRKEALLSSQIEGTQSSFSDLLLHESNEAPGVPLDDVQEVSNYVAAMNHGLERIRGGFPLSLRLIREIHGILLAGGRGERQAPGEFRRSQNWIGGTRPGNARYVPPPPDRLMECLDAFEKFLHDIPGRTPLLVKAALAHVQFETIHPFLDGNGRLGRLLITLLLCSEGALSEPVLYLSLWFKAHREAYYDHLQRVRTDGAWEEWLRFFLEGVLRTSEQAIVTARRLLRLFEQDGDRIRTLGRPALSALPVHQAMQRTPILSVKRAATQSALSIPAATSALLRLAELGIVREITGRKRDRLFAYEAYLQLLSEGTEPIPR
jgi:Fic family protein